MEQKQQRKREVSALSPLDGRYAGKLGGLAVLCGEGGLIRYRVLVECRYLAALCEARVPGSRRLGAAEKKFLEELAVLSEDDVRRIIDIEEKGADGLPPTRHDVKAVEYFIRERLSGGALEDLSELVHFALTSEDVNNLAYALLLRDSLKQELLPALEALLKELDALAVKYAAAPLLARTHGQPAVPTTFGKEFRVFHARLARQAAQLRRFRVLAKLNGASGNYNAHAAACPKTDWEKFSRGFVESFGGLEFNPVTTQIEPHDTYAELFDNLRRANTVLVGFCQDMWRYISAGLVKQRAVAGEVGSSTMPQKVNPIHFENAEGNLGFANAQLAFFSAKLPVSRLQRDLSDSTVERNFGAALGHSLAAYKSVLEGLSRSEPDPEAARAELLAHPEVVAEGVQTVLRREGAAGAYEKLKEFTRGREVTAAGLARFMNGLDLKPAVKAELRRLTPLTYTGLARRIAERR